MSAVTKAIAHGLAHLTKKLPKSIGNRIIRAVYGFASRLQRLKDKLEAISAEELRSKNPCVFPISKEITRGDGDEFDALRGDRVSEMHWLEKRFGWDLSAANGVEKFDLRPEVHTATFPHLDFFLVGTIFFKNKDSLMIFKLTHGGV